MKIRLWKLGSLEHKIAPSEENVQRLADLLFDPNSEVKDIIWGPDIECHEVNQGKMSNLEGFAYWLKGYLTEGCDTEVIRAELDKQIAAYEANDNIGGVVPQSKDVVPAMLDPGCSYYPADKFKSSLENLKKINEGT